MILATVYYPEQWPKERWEQDAALMADAGITRIRMGEFAWSKMEPRSGVFDFSWLEQAIELFGRFQIDVILCSPTPTYPPWLHRMYPDIHQVKSNGQVKEFGQRQDACKNHPGYRKHALRITGALTRALGKHPNVVAWQTDNELGCHGTTRCYCRHCERAFQRWLEDRFGGDIEALNRAWGTCFWSQRYELFSEISLPRDTADRSGTEGQNPGLTLAFFRFSSQVQIEFQRELAGIIKSNSSGRLVTHNLMGGYTDIDYFELARDLDVVSWDNYPFFEIKGRRVPPSPLSHQLMRGLRKRNVWVMEQASGAGGWNYFYPTPEPGQMRLWVYQAVARGADLVSFFRWRSSRFGIEQLWHGLLDHHGIPQRRYEELKQLGAELRALSEELDGSVVSAQVALLFDFDSLWSLEIQPQVEQGFDYRRLANEIACVLSRCAVSLDVVGPHEELSAYRMVIAPSQHLCDPDLAGRLERFVERGGTLVLGPRSGVKDEENAIVEDLLPGLLARLSGCVIEEYDAFSSIPECEMKVQDGKGDQYTAHLLAEVLKPEGESEILLTYAGRYYRGRAAAVKQRLGDGCCLYLGTVPDRQLLRALLGPLLAEKGVFHTSELPDGIEICTREKDSQVYRFYLNHGDEETTVPAIRPGNELLSGKPVAESLTVKPLDLVIVKESA
jgi:beta-galactosidase